MTITVERLEYFIIILVRISAFLAAAPFFNQKTVPYRVKAALAVYISIIMYNILDYEALMYNSTIDYAILVIKETAVGLSLGFVANISLYILDLAGRLIDTEIGFSMVNILNPATNFQISVSGSLYTYLTMLVMLVSNMHYFIISAIVDSFKFIPVGEAKMPDGLYEFIIDFITKYFVIGVRIILPIFACILLVNVVLGVLAKVSPQMNMFVVGMQLKLLVGLLVIFITIKLVPSITDFIFGEMKQMVSDMIKILAP